MGEKRARMGAIYAAPAMRRKFMKKLVCALAIAGAAAITFAAGCATGRSTLLGAPEQPAAFKYTESTSDGFVALKEAAESFADGFTARAIAADDGADNFVVSPISMYSALAMAAECAAGSTREEILGALGADYELLSSEFLNLYRSVLLDGKHSTATLSNSVWLAEGAPILQEGVNSLAQSYGAYSYSADFAGDNEQANLAVRHFVKEHTNGLIDSDFNLDEDTYFALINALYIKDIWNMYGDELALTEESYAFENGDGSVTDMQLMKGKYIAVRPYEGENFTSCYTRTNAGFEIMFILPDEGYSVSEVMTAENIAAAKSADYYGIDEENMIRYNTRCIFPAFDAEGNIEAKDILKDMGIVELFDSVNGANLSNILGGDAEACCRSAKHIAKLEVNRRGIEGAAVTVIDVGPTSAGPGEYTEVDIDFVADRAFGFVLLNSYGTTLFAGAVNAV